MKPTEDDLASLKGTSALIGSQPFNERMEMARGTLFRTLLCVATQQVMGNKPSVKSGDSGFINGGACTKAGENALQAI